MFRERPREELQRVHRQTQHPAYLLLGAVDFAQLLHECVVDLLPWPGHLTCTLTCLSNQLWEKAKPDQPMLTWLYPR